MGVAGWLTLLVQSMVAAPLWAASHALPEGDGFAGERAKQGYMLLLNVAMRPILLVLGFVLSLGVMWAVAYMSQIMMGFSLSSMLSTQGNTAKVDIFDQWGLKGDIAQIAVYMASTLFSTPSMVLGVLAIFIIGTVTTIVLIHKSFDIIYETADDVIRWIGGSAQLGGESQGTQRAITMLAGQFGKFENKMIQGTLGGRGATNALKSVSGANTNAETPKAGGGGNHADNVGNQNDGKEKTKI